MKNKTSPYQKRALAKILARIMWDVTANAVRKAEKDRHVLEWDETMESTHKGMIELAKWSIRHGLKIIDCRAKK